VYEPREPVISRFLVRAGWRPEWLRDEDTRMPDPGPELVESSREAFVRESLQGLIDLTRPGLSGRGPVMVIGPVRVEVRFWFRGRRGARILGSPLGELQVHSESTKRLAQ
jgi:hypothetical protein